MKRALLVACLILAGTLISSYSYAAYPMVSSPDYRDAVQATGSSSGTAGGGDWLVGGEDGIADVVNPNDINGDGTLDDPVICTANPATCIIQTSAGLIYFATSSNQVDATTWALTNEEEVWSGFVNSSGWAVPAFTTTAGCLEQRDDLEQATLYDCSSYAAQFAKGRRVLLTRVVSSNDGTMAGSNGCGFRLYDEDAASDVAGSGWNFPANQSTSLALHEPDTSLLTATLAAGTPYSLQVSDGPNCPNGASCSCGAGVGRIWITIYGLVIE